MFPLRKALPMRLEIQHEKDMNSSGPDMVGDWPKISIVTPCYNQVKFIERTIRSVLDQQYPNLEYIIIDGGSTDGSVGIIKKYQDKLTYWVSEKDHGQTHAINKGFYQATGDIVAWLNSDDEYCPGALKTVARTFMADKKLDFVFGDELAIDEDGSLIRAGRFTRFNFSAFIVLGMTFQQCTAFWKRELFEKHGYLDESKRFCMDYEFFCRVGQYIHTRYVRRYLGRFRWHRESKSTTIQDVRLQEQAALKEQYLQAACKGYPVWLVCLWAYAYRAFWYTLQGDGLYILRGIVRRLLPKCLRPKWL